MGESPPAAVFRPAAVVAAGRNQRPPSELLRKAPHVRPVPDGASARDLSHGPSRGRGHLILDGGVKPSSWLGLSPQRLDPHPVTLVGQPSVPILLALIFALGGGGGGRAGPRPGGCGEGSCPLPPRPVLPRLQPTRTHRHPACRLNRRRPPFERSKTRTMDVGGVPLVLCFGYVLVLSPKSRLDI